MKNGIAFNQVDRFTQLVEKGKTVEQIDAVAEITEGRVKTVAKTLGLTITCSAEAQRIADERRLEANRRSNALRNRDNRKPEAHTAQRKNRPCLGPGCNGKKFMSTHIGNRMCTSCKGLSEVNGQVW